MTESPDCTKPHNNASQPINSRLPSFSRIVETEDSSPLSDIENDSNILPLNKPALNLSIQNTLEIDFKRKAEALSPFDTTNPQSLNTTKQFERETKNAETQTPKRQKCEETLKECKIKLIDNETDHQVPSSPPPFAQNDGTNSTKEGSKQAIKQPSSCLTENCLDLFILPLYNSGKQETIRDIANFSNENENDDDEDDYEDDDDDEEEDYDSEEEYDDEDDDEDDDEEDEEDDEDDYDDDDDDEDDYDSEEDDYDDEDDDEEGDDDECVHLVSSIPKKYRTEEEYLELESRVDTLASELKSSREMIEYLAAKVVELESRFQKNS